MKYASVEVGKDDQVSRSASKFTSIFGTITRVPKASHVRHNLAGAAPACSIRTHPADKTTHRIRPSTGPLLLVHARLAAVAD